MATHDYVLANQSGSSFRTDLNNALAAIVSGNSSGTEPSTTYAYMIWNDSGNGLRKIRNSSNNAWITLSTLTGGNVFDDDVTFNGASYNLVWDKSDNALEFADNAKAKFGTGNDLEIHHDGTRSYIQNSTGNLEIQSDTFWLEDKTNGHGMIYAVADGAVELFFDNVKKFETYTNGVEVTGTLWLKTAGGKIQLNDAIKLICGNGDDLQIYHDTVNYIDSAATQLRIDTDVLRLRDDAGEHYLEADANAGVKLFYDNSNKFETTNSGVKVNGQFVITDSNYFIKLDDNVKFKSGNGDDLQIYHDGSNSYIQDSGTGELRLRGTNIRFSDDDGSETLALFVDNGACEFYYDNSKKLETTSAGIKVTGTSVTFSAPDGGNRYYFGEMGNSASAQLSLYDSSDAQQIRLSANGANDEDSYFLNQKITIGTTNSSDTAGIGHKIHGDSQVIPYITTTADSNNGAHSTYHLYNTNASNNGYRFYVQVNGGIVNHAGNNTNLCDEREKKNITDAPSQLSKIKNWKLRNFRYNTEADSEPLKFGVIAQEIATVNPELVTEDFKVRVDDDGNDVLRKGVKEEQMMMISIKALQELIAKVETLETKVAALEG